MPTLLIVESPNKKSKIRELLGDGFEVEASYGHVRDLPEKDIGVAAPDYRPHYVVGDDRAKATLARLRKAVDRCDRVLLATDLDREGEAIAFHLAETLHLRQPERITYGEVTATALRAAVASPRPINDALVRAQEARRVLDRLVGYTVSPSLSNAAGERLSAGRVQSPAVRLVVDRERAIRRFEATTHYGAELTFSGERPWLAQWIPVLSEGEDYMLDRAVAEAVARTPCVRVLTFKATEAKKAPPPPFITSTLQQAAHSQLKFKPKLAMDLAQKLFEQGAITYMRTDALRLADEACDAIEAYARSTKLPVAAVRPTWKSKAAAQEAHEAIRPTHIEQEDAGETDQERAMYRMIRQRTLACLLAEARYAVRTAELEALDAVGGALPKFIARGRKLTDPGWKAVYDEPEDDDGEEAKAEEALVARNPMPVLQPGAELPVAIGIVVTKTTEAPRRFSQASLVKALETHGIGRPSTYAAIMENITTRGYVTEDKKGCLAATPKAERVIDQLVGTFAFAELDYTRELENELDEIAQGRKGYREVVAAAHTQLEAELATRPVAPMHPCPECGAALRRRTGKKGVFWGCSAYPTCAVTAPDVDGAPGVGAEPSAGEHTCPHCAKSLRRRTCSADADPKKRGYDFWGCTGYPACKSTFKPDATGAPILS